MRVLRFKGVQFRIEGHKPLHNGDTIGSDEIPLSVFLCLADREDFEEVGGAKPSIVMEPIEADEDDAADEEI